MEDYNTTDTVLTNLSSSQNNTLSSTRMYIEPEGLRTFRCVLIAIVLFASLFGNSMVIRAILGKRYKPFVYCLVTNLAVGELVSTVCIPFVVAYLEINTWIFGDFLCHLIIPLKNVANTVVTTTIAVISVRRYQVVTGIGLNFPRTRKGGWLVIACIWGYAFAVCSPMFIYYQKTTVYSNKVAYCLAIYPDTKTFFGGISRRYSIAKIVLGYGIQVLIMIVAYGAVILNLKKQIHSIIKNARPRIDSTLSNTRITEYNLDAHRTSSPPSFHQMVPLQQIIAKAQLQEEQQKSRSKPEVDILLDQEGDLTRMFYIIVVVFIIFYLPSNIFFILEISNSFKVFPSMFVVRKWLALLSYLTFPLHPLCYGTMSRFYAKAFRKLILCKC